MAICESTTEATQTVRKRARLAVAVLCVFGGLLAMAVQKHAFESEFTGADTPAGFIGNAGKIDITTASGDVYVADNSRNRVYRFDSSGAFQSQITGFDFSSANGIAVDNSGTASDANLVVDDST